MAKQYRVVGTTIQHGRKDGSKVEFAPGDIVTGLTTDEMKSLWEAGVLEEVVVADAPKVAKQTETPKVPAEGTQTQTEGGDKDKA